MRLLRTVAVTFALYSRIPMPHFEWRDEDMTYSIALFPWVGAVIGLVFVCVYRAGILLSVPLTAVCLLMTAVPVVITGGFHIDGIMDVSDALSSYGSREDKLRILKDPHIGAFAVIRLCVCGLVYMASLITLAGSAKISAAGSAYEAVLILAAGFFTARAFSALGVLNLRSAKNEGMLFYEASCAGSGRKANNILCSLWICAVSILIIYIDPVMGIAEMLTAAACFAWYKYKCYKEFGGITGDTAGWFVTVCETALAAAAALVCLSRGL
ncbi:MAG: adenosylcobinamide-GDP ribazoletransferase [Mogibacterium sp.]|nr:adenosylcobinamide-GDP ribazoletransferase [Mogibacterium sp.]